MNYKINKGQLEYILSIVQSISDETVSKAKKFEKQYHLMNLISTNNDIVKAALFNLAQTLLSEDKKHYLYSKYKFINDRQKRGDEMLKQARLAGMVTHDMLLKQNLIAQQYNECIYEYTWTELKELSDFITDEQLQISNAYDKINQMLKDYINSSHDIPIVEIIETPVLKRRKFIETMLFNKKDIPAKKMQVIDSVITFNDFIKDRLNGQTSIILIMLGNYYMLPDKEESMIRINNYLSSLSINE